MRRGTAWKIAAIAALAAGGCGDDSRPLPFGPNPGFGGRRLIVFASDRLNSFGRTDVLLYDVDTPGIIPLQGLNTAAAAERQPALSADAERIFFAAARGVPGDTNLYVYDLGVRALIALPQVNTIAAETEPAPAADGRHLAFVRAAGPVRRVLLAYGWPPDSVGAPPGLNAAAPHEDFSPACDSTARRIAFVSTRAGQRDVLVWDRDSAGVLSLPELASSDDDLEPSITPNGRYVAFASNRPSTLGGYRVLLYDLEARAFVPLPGLAVDGNDRHPSLSPDAGTIAFQSDRSTGVAGWDVWIWERAAGRARSTPAIATALEDFEPWLRAR